jgi:Uma2 family endonuclease
MNAPMRALETVEPRRFTAEEFLRLYEAGVLGKKERLRLIGGVIYVTAPTGPEHAIGHGRLIAVLSRALGPTFELAAEPTLRFTDHDVTEPDVVVVPPGPRPRPPIEIGEIQLVVETAHASLKDDTSVMAAIYAAAGIKDYWVLDLEHQKLLVFRNPKPEGYDPPIEVERGESIAPLCASDAAIAVDDLF